MSAADRSRNGVRGSADLRIFCSVVGHKLASDCRPDWCVAARYDELVARDDIDLIYVATQPALHA